MSSVRGERPSLMNSAAMMLRFATAGNDFQRSPSTFSEAGKRSALPGKRKSVYNLRRISNKTIEINVSLWFLKNRKYRLTKSTQIGEQVCWRTLNLF